jgi:hypothetical protein
MTGFCLRFAEYICGAADGMQVLRLRFDQDDKFLWSVEMQILGFAQDDKFSA